MNWLRWKFVFYRFLQATRVAPSIWMLRNPFKVLEFERIMSKVDLRPSDVVLDLGCGRGIQTQVLARHCQRALGVDTSQESIARANNLLRHSCVEDRVAFFSDRIEDAPIASFTLDKIFSFCVLEHIADAPSVLRHIFNLLKPNGELHLSVDSLANIKDVDLIRRHRSQHSVYQYFTAESLREQLEIAGFEVISIEPLFVSEYARIEFEKLVRNDDYPSMIPEAIRTYLRLKDDERRCGDTEGIMLIGRARRPPVESSGLIQVAKRLPASGQGMRA